MWWDMPKVRPKGARTPCSADIYFSNYLTVAYFSWEQNFGHFKKICPWLAWISLGVQWGTMGDSGSHSSDHRGAQNFTPTNHLSFTMQKHPAEKDATQYTGPPPPCNIDAYGDVSPLYGGICCRCNICGKRWRLLPDRCLCCKMYYLYFSFYIARSVRAGEKPLCNYTGWH